jgi:2-polyprenyl-6-methoxyphenol hydroxylase-like FAD-dependent oxidoreductase
MAAEPPERTTCCVVGGGPAGLVLGLLLARAGVQVTILEKHGDFLHDFRGDTVHPTTLNLLDDLGLGERFAEIPQTRVTEVVLPDRRGGTRRIGNFAALRRWGVRHPYVAVVPQWDLLDLLAEAAEAESGFRLYRGVSATSIIREDGRVVGVTHRRIGVAGDTVDGETRAELTIACDGRDSVLRADSGLPVAGVKVPFDTWWFRLSRRPGEQVSVLTRCPGRGRFAVVIPREGYFQIGYVARKALTQRCGIAVSSSSGRTSPTSYRSTPTGSVSWPRWMRSTTSMFASTGCADGTLTGCCASVTPRTRCPRSEVWVSGWRSRTP